MKKCTVTKKNSKAHQLALTNKLLKRVGYKNVGKQSSSEWREEYSASLKNYPDERSTHIPGNGLKKDKSGFIQESAKYPTGVAYNKGNIQVLMPGEIKHAGRK